MSTMNYYVVLGIAEDADEDTVRSAFRALARRYHPDAGDGSSVVDFQRVREAYETLGDPDRRDRYDRQLRASRVRPLVPTTRVTLTRSAYFEDVVEELFASFDHDWFWWRRRR